MSRHKYIDRICIIAVVISLLLTILFINGEALGLSRAEKLIGYENRLFDTERVHTIDIVIDDWDGFIETAQSEEYSPCSVIIDGEAYKNVGIRGKGNTSLSSVASMNSSRYSFKVEFDCYDKNKSYYGLDKLCLNNIIQDNTYMKDYLTYRLMNEFGVSAPLCSYAFITVNGEDWGLYLAVEGVEEAFLRRNYGSSYGELYKPDSTSFGGGRGNGKGFNMDDFMENFDSEEGENSFEAFGNGSNTSDSITDRFAPPDMGGVMPQRPDNSDNSSDTASSNSNGFTPPDMSGGIPQRPDNSDFSGMDGNRFNKPDMGGFGGDMGSDDVKLKYTDDDYDSYSNIFDSAKTDITDSDKDRLISSLKSLSNYESLESVVNIDEVIRYFVVHNYVRNGDSYTGSIIHNYYLYEEEGVLSMIPWDYNLAFGTFRGGNGDSEVNAAIDSPVSGDVNDRPMVGWIFSCEEYTELYHRYFSEFIEQTDIASIIYKTAALISDYVERDPTKFCTYDEFTTGVDTLRQFCELRTESVRAQLNGTIPSTTDGQNADSSALIDASGISLSDMGTMNAGSGKGGFGGMDKGNSGGRDWRNESDPASENPEDTSVPETPGNMPLGRGNSPSFTTDNQ